MPANIDTMFSGRNLVPWHGLGTIVAGTPNSADAIKLAGLDWTVEKHKLFARIPTDEKGEHGVFKQVNHQYATVRMDTKKPIGVVGSRYEIIQNRDAFDVLDSLVAEGRAEYETAGSLGNGETVWMLMRTPEDLKVGGDIIKPYFLARTSHDGSSKLIIRDVATRVVCANTLAVAMGESVAKQLTIAHTASASDRMKAAAKVLGLVSETQQAFITTAEALLSQTFTRSEMEALVGQLIPKPDESDPTVTKREVTNWEKRFESLMNDAYGASDLNDIRFTKWGAYNAITDYEQHLVRMKGDETAQNETRFKRAMLNGALAQKAFTLLSN